MLRWLLKRLGDAGPAAVISGRALGRFPALEVQRLLRARVLIEQRKADTWPACAHCNCGYGARPIREIEGRLVACCPHDAAEDEILSHDDLRRFTIDPNAWVHAIAKSGAMSMAWSSMARMSGSPGRCSGSTRR